MLWYFQTICSILCCSFYKVRTNEQKPTEHKMVNTSQCTVSLWCSTLTLRLLMSYIYGAPLFLMFLDHTQRRTTVGRTPLDEWSARRTDLYLTTHDTHNRQISMPRWDSNPRFQQVSGRSGFESHRGHGYLSVVSVMCCQVEVSATSWSLVQRSPTDRGASLCVI